MNWFRRKKDDVQPVKGPIEIKVKAEHQMELRQLFDQFSDAKKGKQAARFIFWKAVVAYYPQVAEGDWNIHWGGYSATITEDIE